MIDPTTSKMLLELAASDTDRDNHLPYLDDMIEQYHGMGFKNDTAPKNDYRANHWLEYLTLINPRIVHDNPRITVKSRRRGEPEKVAAAMKHGGNKWIADSNFDRFLMRSVVDFSFAWSVAYVEHRKGRKDEYRRRNPKNPGWPIVERVPIKRFAMDCAALSVDDARWMGHYYVRDKEDLLREAREHPERGWNVAEIEAQPTDKGIDRLKERAGKAVPPRDELVLFQYWVRDRQEDGDPGPEEGFYGTIYTIIIDGKDENDVPKGRSIREPMPYWGVPEGPYVVGGAYVVPDDPWPLSPFAAVYRQVEEFNLQVTAALHASRRYKKLVFVDDAETSTMTAAVNAPDGYVVPVPGLKESSGRAVVEVEIGGVSDNQLRMMELWQGVLERVSGIDSAQRGEVEGRGTATEVAIADKVTDVRVGNLRDRFTDFVNGIMRRVLFYLWHDDDIEFPLNPEAGDEFDMESPWFHGGDSGQDSGFTFWDLELDIETMSMERTTEALQQRRVLQAVQIIGDIAPLMRMVPEVRWPQLLEKVGSVLNIPDMVDLIDLDLAQQLLGVPVSGPEGQPTLSKAGGGGGGELPLDRPAGGATPFLGVLTGNQAAQSVA